MKLTPKQIKEVKSQGFLHTKDGNFSMRIITVNGVLTSKQMRNLCEVAEKFGNGKISFTSRLTVELPCIKYEDIETVKEYVAKDGMSTGGTGSKVRPVVACKGTVCHFGNIDTQGIAAKIHHDYYEGWRQVTLPHKFKIAVGGCPNNCVKPDLNDLGIVGVKIPNFQSDKCRGCLKCMPAESCPIKISKVENGKLNIDKSQCNNCGVCVGKCPFGAIPDGKVMYKIYIAGRWGKKIRLGTAVSQLFEENEVYDMIEKTMLFFKDQGISGERLSDTVERIGWENVEKILLSNELLERKEEILAKETKGGASC